MLIAKKICDQLSDLEIVQKSLSDVDYLSCMYDRYEAKLLRYITRISSIPDDEAEDILQESFIKIWRNLNSYDPSIKLSSWLYRIVHNETISQWRKKTGSGKYSVVEMPKHLYEQMQDEFMIPGLYEENANMIQKVLEEMPVKYKEVLVLKFFEKLNYEEISDVLKIPEGTVATRLNRAKKTFIKISKARKFQVTE